MKAVLSIVMLALTLVQTTAFAQSRVDAAMDASIATRNADVIATLTQIDTAKLKLLNLQEKLDEAKSKNPGRTAMVWIERAALVGAAASVVSMVHGLMHISNSGGILTLPGAGFFYGILGGAVSGGVFGAAKGGEVALTSADVTILLGQVAQTQKDLSTLKTQLKTLQK